MTYWTWNGHNNDEPTLHVYSDGLFNIWDDGLTTETHWIDADPPTLKPEVLENLTKWGGEWNADNLEVRFPNGNDAGAMMWKLTYHSKTGCTSPEKNDLWADENGYVVLKGSGHWEKKSK